MNSYNSKQKQQGHIQYTIPQTFYNSYSSTTMKYGSMTHEYFFNHILYILVYINKNLTGQIVLV